MNYKLLEPEQFKLIDVTNVKDLEELPAGDGFIFEYPIEYGGTLENEHRVVKDSLHAFDITTGAAEA